MSRTTVRGASALAVAAALLALTGGAVAIDRSGLLDPADRATPPVAAPTATATIESLDAQLRRVAGIVERIRELRFDETPTPTFLAPDELAERTAGFLEDYTEEQAREDAILLERLGAIPSGTDLRELLSTALGEQVAGFYDPESGELVVGTDAGEGRLGPLDELTLAHELQHALADQALGLPGEREIPPGEEDGAFAVQSLIEGDATLTMARYAEQALSVIDQARLLAAQGRLAAELGNLTALPHYVQRSLLFPYEEGMAFVSHLEARGGWELVDAAYTRTPRTSLEILEPERYLTGQTEVVDPRDPGPLGAGWEEVDRVGVGAADLLFLFEAPGGDASQALDDPRGAAVRWRGGEARVWEREGTYAVGLALAGEAGLCDAITAWYRAAFPRSTFTVTGTGLRADGEQDAQITCLDAGVRIGIAEDARTAASIAR